MRKKYPTLGDVMVITGIAALMGFAIREQLRLSKDQRTWHGTLFGIPYDFCWPTIERLRETFWNKKTARVLVPHAFGMGWRINFSPLINPSPAEQRPEPPVTRSPQKGRVRRGKLALKTRDARKNDAKSLALSSLVGHPDAL